MIMEFTKIYCINKGKIKSLTIGKQYELIKVQNGTHQDSNIPYSSVWVANDNGVVKHYSSKRFVSVSKYREQILNEILG